MTFGRLGKGFVALSLSAMSLPATTFIVPDDGELVRKASAVVVATVTSAHAELTPAGGIETVATLHVEETIKGKLNASAPIVVTQPGGWVGSRRLVVAGTAKFIPGQRALFFLVRSSEGKWVPVDMLLGKFDFVPGPGGVELLVRGASEEEVFGWSRDGKSHEELPRDGRRFLQFVRSAARGEAAAIDYSVSSANVTHLETSPSAPSPDALASSFLLGSARWQQFDSATPNPAGFRTRGTQNGMTDSVGSVQRAMAAWTNDAGSSVDLRVVGTTTALGGLRSSDDLSSIVFNDPSGEIAGSFSGTGTLAIGGYWADAPHTYKGESIYTIVEGDLVIQDGVVLTSTQFDEMMTHELGHALGFRHSNQGAPLDASAIMNSTLSGRLGTALQAWDRLALSTVYGSVAPPQPPPASSGRGDANGDFTVSTADVFYLISFLFSGGPAPVGAGDANGDGTVSTADVFYLISFLFSGGPAPR